MRTERPYPDPSRPGPLPGPGHRRPAPHPAAPLSPLHSTTFRVVESLWVWLPLFGAGLLCWAGFLYAGIRTHRMRYVLASGVYFALLVLTLVLASRIDAESDLFILPALMLLGLWVIPTIHGVIVRRTVLREIAEQAHWYAAPSATPTEGTERPLPPAPGSVPVNRATVAMVSAIPGVSQETAEWILAVRDAEGGFRDLNHLVSATALDRFDVLRIENYLDFR